MKCEVCNKECTGVTCANWDNEKIKMVCDECLNMNNEISWEEAYKDLRIRYRELLQNHKQLMNNFSVLNERKEVKSSSNNKLRAEIRSLHRKLRDANRGAERNAWIAHDLAKELVEYKIKHPEKLQVEFVTGTSVSGNSDKHKDQSVTYTYDGKAHTAKILQQQQDNV